MAGFACGAGLYRVMRVSGKKGAPLGASRIAAEGKSGDGQNLFHENDHKHFARAVQGQSMGPDF
jgi:hypothetical protein